MKNYSASVMTVEQTSSRHYGMDLFKLFSMFLVVLLHTLSHGALVAAAPMSVNYEVGFFIEALAYCCVDCFALASGYVGVDSRFRHRNIINLWLQVVFYTVAIMVVFMIFMPSSNMSAYGDSPVLFAFTPVLSNIYWYYSAYFAMSFFIPFMNIGLSKLNERQAAALTASVIAVCIFLQYFSKASLFIYVYGYNATWLTILYALGASLKKINIRKYVKSRHVFLAGYFLSAFLAWVGKYVMESRNKASGAFESDQIFLQYTSLPVLLSAMSLVLYFSYINVTHEKIQAVIRKLVAASFGVYLIHTHPFVFGLRYWSGLGSISSKPALVMVGQVFLNAVVIFVLCIIIDLARGALFKLCMIRKMVDAICDTFASYVNPAKMQDKKHKDGMKTQK